MVKSKTKKPRRTNTSAVNIPLPLHQKLVAFCDSQQPCPWPVGHTAAVAIETYLTAMRQQPVSGSATA